MADEYKDNDNPVNKGQGAENELNFDPMTGEQIGEPGLDEDIQFDPMTGEPVVGDSDEEIQFDPMTGEPVMGDSDEDIYFDPMTGEPVGEVAKEELNFDPMTGKPIGKGKFTHKFSKKHASIIGIVALLTIVIFAGVRSGTFLTKRNKVLLATKNTFEPNYIMKDLNVLPIIKSNDYTVSLETDIAGGYWGILDISVNGSFHSDGKKKGLVVDVSSRGMDISLGAKLDKSKLYVDIPMIETLFVYDYKADKSDFVEDIIDEAPFEVDDTLDTIYNEDYSGYNDNLVEIFMDEYKTLKFSSTDKEKIKVNGKERNCKGYTTTITGDNFINVLEDWNDVNDEYFGVEIFDKYFIDSFEDIRDLDITFYLYKNQLAGVFIESRYDKVFIEINGGDYPLQNVVVESDNTGTIFVIEGQRKNKTEIMEIIIGYDFVIDLEYDYKTGDYDLSMGDYYDVLEVEGNIKSSNRETELHIDKIRYGDVVNRIDFLLVVQKGSNINSIGMNSEEEYVNDMDERDMEDILEEFDYYY